MQGEAGDSIPKRRQPDEGPAVRRSMAAERTLETRGEAAWAAALDLPAVWKRPWSRDGAGRAQSGDRAGSD